MLIGFVHRLMYTATRSIQNYLQIKVQPKCACYGRASCYHCAAGQRTIWQSPLSNEATHDVGQFLQWHCSNGIRSNRRLSCHHDMPPRSVAWRRAAQVLPPQETQVTHQTRAARYEQPIVAVKQHAQSWMTMISFQSTPSCNFASVNVINSCSLYAHTKQRGWDEHKRARAIKMNEGRELYWKLYWVIDRMDHLIKNCSMKCRTCKCWHKAMIHAKAMAVVICILYVFGMCGKSQPRVATKPISRNTGKTNVNLQSNQ